MTPVRLETTVELRPDTGAGRLSVSARHEAVLDGGDRVLLLDDRGWVEEARGAGSGELGPLRETDIAFTARTVVGPDEPWPGRTAAEAERDHWDAHAETLRRHGVAAGGAELSSLPHRVVLGPLLRALVESGPQRAPETP